LEGFASPYGSYSYIPNSIAEIDDLVNADLAWSSFFASIVWRARFVLERLRFYDVWNKELTLSQNLM